MGYVICKTCYNQNYDNWIRPFEEQVSDPQVMPQYNENIQHYSIYDVNEIANTLKNGEMLEILCVKCKMSHIGKDQNGVIKTRQFGDTDWTIYNL